MKRIAVNTITTKKHSGGAYQIAYNFMMETLKHQNDAEWLYIVSKDVDEAIGDNFDTIRNIRYFVFPTQPDFKGTYRQVKKELHKWEESYKPDVIYTISSPCYFSFRTPEVMRFANAWVTNPTKEAWSVMPWKAWLRMKLYRLNQIRLIKKAKYIITQSETVRKGLLNITGLPESNVKVVPNVLPKVFSEVPVVRDFDTKWIDVSCAAAPVPHKNLDIIPAVLAKLKQVFNITNVRLHLTIPEDNDVIKQIVKECSEMGMADNIVNHGRCSQSQLIPIYNQCFICFMPTLLETFSASSLEAMHFRQFIVATDYGFNREVIGDAGLYYRPKDALEAASKIVQIIRDKELRNALEIKMSERIKIYFNYQEHFNSILDFLKNIK